MSWYSNAQKSANPKVKALLKKYTNADKNVKASLQEEIITLLKSEMQGNSKTKKENLHLVKKTVSQKIMDPAQNAHLAKMGITREEELFESGVFLTPMNTQQRIEMRRSIYAKKKAHSAALMEEYKKRQAAQKEKALNDPKTREFNEKQKFANAIIDGLLNNMNIHAILKANDDLTLKMIVKLSKDKDVGSRLINAKATFLEDLDKFVELYGDKIK